MPARKRAIRAGLVVLRGRIELPTSSLPMRCSTTELPQHLGVRRFVGPENLGPKTLKALTMLRNSEAERSLTKTEGCRAAVDIAAFFDRRLCNKRHCAQGLRGHWHRIPERIAGRIGGPHPMTEARCEPPGGISGGPN